MTKAVLKRIAHISDIHFGRISNQNVVKALVEDINKAKVDLVVVSCDLTQRAFGHQFRAARRMLKAFDAPTLVVPGNHDVFPLWRLFSRLLDPLRRYKNIISRDLAPRKVLYSSGSATASDAKKTSTRVVDGLVLVESTVRRETVPEVVVQGINSAFGWTVQGGRITAKELDQIKTGFKGVPKSAFKVLVVHHHLAELEELGDHDLSKGAHEAFATAHEMNVDLILSGHLHISHVAHVSIHEGANPIIVATSGTSTSSRGRGQDPLGNYYNLIEVQDGRVDIEEKRFDAAHSTFTRSAQNSFRRNN